MIDFKPIKTWAEDDKPREKLIKLGKSGLSNSELIAILIASGTVKKSALDISREILDHAEQDLLKLSTWTVRDFCKFEGVGEAKALTIMAALELASRRMRQASREKKTITSSLDAYNVMRVKLEDLNHEEFWLVTLNRMNSVIGEYRISEGGITSTVVDQRKIFKLALEDKSTGILLFHNHPSGNLVPSNADSAITKKLSDGGKLLDINVVDHIIITQSGYFSFADEGLM